MNIDNREEVLDILTKIDILTKKRDKLDLFINKLEKCEFIVEKEEVLVCTTIIVASEYSKDKESDEKIYVEINMKVLEEILMKYKMDLLEKDEKYMKKLLRL